MYIPAAFHVEEREELLAFMRAHNFATLVGMVEGRLFATHLPLTIHDQGSDTPILLRGHLAKANPQSGALEAGELLLLFQGAHAYVSPTNYEAQASVPTWNYTAVHAYGRAIVQPETASQLVGLHALIETHEPSYREQWESLPERYRTGMLGGLVAFEITVTHLEGKYKLSQNRSHADQERVAAHLLQSSDPAAVATGRLMQERLCAPHRHG